MKVILTPSPLRGELYAIPSKSHVHRLLICAALASAPTLLRCPPTSAVDINATINCLAALGARITRVSEGFRVIPIDRENLPKSAVLPVVESGSTLRFMLPVVCALGVSGRFEMAGRLPKRPLSPLDRQLKEGGVKLWWEGENILLTQGRLAPGSYTLPGNISSQYITGLLLALPLLGGQSTLEVTGAVESEDYIKMTLDAIGEFGFTPSVKEGRYILDSPWPFVSPGEVAAEGDWSNAAFWLSAGAMPGGDITLRGLNRESSQGDREVALILERMGARVEWKGDSIRVREGARRGVEIDARPIPDAIPVLSVVAAVSEGRTLMANAGRLRIKESDRLSATAQTLNALGGKARETRSLSFTANDLLSPEPDNLIIEGLPRLVGGSVEGFGDHRMAMMAGVAAGGCTGPITLTGAEAVSKSYPHFWEDMKLVGGRVEIYE